MRSSPPHTLLAHIPPVLRTGPPDTCLRPSHPQHVQHELDTVHHSLGNVLLGIAVVLSVIISLLTGTMFVPTGLTCNHFGICAAGRTSRIVLSATVLGASQLYSRLKVVVNRYKVVMFTFATRVASRIACALGKLVLHILAALFRKAASAIGCFVLRTVQFVAIWFTIAVLEMVSCVVLGSGTFFLKGGKFAREYSVVALKMFWCTAMNICKIVTEEAHTAFLQSPRHMIPREFPLLKTLAVQLPSRQSIFYGPLPLASSVPVSVTSLGIYTSCTILSAYTYTYYGLLPVISITQIIRDYDVLTFLVAGAVHSTELLKLTHVALFSSTPETSFLSADDSFESEATLCEDSDASDSDSEQDDEQRTTDKLNPHAPAYTPSASLLAKALISKFSETETSSKPLDPRKEAFIPSGLRIIAPVQPSSEIFAVSVAATALPWTPLETQETSTPKKPLDPRKEAFVPSGLRNIAPVQPETSSEILAVSLTAAALSWTPLETSPKKLLDSRKEAFVPARMRVSHKVAAALATTLKKLASTASPKFAQASPPASSPETVAEEPTELVKKKHGKRVPTWLRRQRKREREAAERATAR